MSFDVRVILMDGTLEMLERLRIVLFGQVRHSNADTGLGFLVFVESLLPDAAGGLGMAAKQARPGDEVARSNRCLRHGLQARHIGSIEDSDPQKPTRFEQCVNLLVDSDLGIHQSTLPQCGTKVRGIEVLFDERL